MEIRALKVCSWKSNPVREKRFLLCRGDAYAIVQPEITLDTHSHTYTQLYVSVLPVKIDEQEHAVRKVKINSVRKLHIH